MMTMKVMKVMKGLEFPVMALPGVGYVSGPWEA
jgi:hypothetical protein